MTSMRMKALIRNIAKEKNINSGIVLRNYMLERLLERISKSKYKDNFVLKGGMLVASIVGIDSRSTIDLDATLRHFPLSKEKLEKAFGDILKIEIDDGITIKLLNITEIREDAEYHGFRLSLMGMVDESKIPLKVDITTGDKITPDAVKYSFKLLLEDRNIEVLAYNLETVLAEKVESIISRGEANTRMRDFYDIYILTKFQAKNIDKDLFKKALTATSKNRGSENQIFNTENILINIKESEKLKSLWKNYIVKNPYAQDISWDSVINTLYRWLFD
ncbi:MAG: nucleotidyl transferase AbiEii/AbiGii toxin family protein [Acutalibacteraceae bacterium]